MLPEIYQSILLKLYPPSALMAILWYEEGIALYNQSEISDRLSWLESLEICIRNEPENPSYVWGFSDAKNQAHIAIIQAINDCKQCLGLQKCEKPYFPED